MANTYVAKNYDTFIGIDTDKNSFSFTVINRNAVTKSAKIPSSPNMLYSYIKKNFDPKKTICAYEAGPTGFYLHDHLTSNSCDCVVTPPASIPKAANDKVKTNKIDSRKIACCLAADQIKPIRVPSIPYRELRHLVKTHENYVDGLRVAKQRIKALLLYENLHPDIKDSGDNWSIAYIEILKTLPMSPILRHRMDTLLADMEYHRRQAISNRNHIKEFLENHPDIEKNVRFLTSVPGIGLITASAILGKIGDPCNLRNEREIAAFVGLVPVEYSTGDDINKGPISGSGDRRLRSLLIETAWTAIRHDTELEQFYYRIKNKNHPRGAAQKAITAVARKLTQRIYRVLKDQREYVIHKDTISEQEPGANAFFQDASKLIRV